MSHYGGGAEHGDKFNKKDKYGNPIQYTGGNIGGHGHKTQTTGGGEYVTKGHGGQGGGILHRSNSSSSSSSEDDGQGGRRKKSIKEKIKKKLPGGNKPTIGQDAYAHGHGATTTTPGEGYGSGYGAATTTHHVYGGHGGTVEQQPEKKGFMEKIRDKLPGHH